MGWWLVMAYIWENYSEDKLFCRGDCVSPYLEMMTAEEAIGYVNPMLRFSSIFNELEKCREVSVQDELEADTIQKWATELENILFHYLAHIDLLSGMDIRQIKVNYLERELAAGAFGRFIAEHWDELTSHDKRVILYTLADKYESEAVDHYFLLAAQKLWDYVSLLYEKSTETYYLHVSVHITAYTSILMKVIIYLFWDGPSKPEITWNRHYGIIGSNDTMRISEICIV